MDDLADRLDAAADALTAVERRLSTAAVPAAAFGADNVGRPGRLGRVLHAHWDTVLTARARESADAALRLIDTARAVRTTAQEYDRTDDEAARRLRREL
jgi:hypothetical protein